VTRRHTTGIFLCSFTEGLEDIPVRKRRDIGHVLAVLDKNPRKRFSVFEATANQAIATTMTRLVQEAYITTDNSCGYPWTKYELTAKGHAAKAAA
jgi:hypothetical protein